MEKNNYYISIVVPVCNNPEIFQRIVSTIINQIKNKVEIVIVDNSKKEFLDVNKQHVKLFNDERIKHIVTKTKDFGSATEIGINSATGTYVLLMFNKEQWNPNEEEKNGFLEKVVTKFKGE